ncbi:MAG: nicotinate (nicotinamide) nucleotide adenylyltransferase [Spirochaetales bacterium]|nr:nicotinate (nicotinamide) nucleotide adenylyltransferase [Spirochaetales bacterium]
MKLIMLGGTFNPPHVGHLKIADEVRRHFGYERLVLVPSYRPAHKSVDQEVSFHHRMKMVELSVQGWPDTVVSSCEHDRGGVSYSIDTILYLKELYKVEGRPGLIIGDDLVPGFAGWHRAEELSELADIIICHRGRPEDLDFPFRHRYFQNTMVEASSTDIREAVRAGQDVADLLPTAVLDYIRREGLYGA